MTIEDASSSSSPKLLHSDIFKTLDNGDFEIEFELQSNVINLYDKRNNNMYRIKIHDLITFSSESPFVLQFMIDRLNSMVNAFNGNSSQYSGGKVSFKKNKILFKHKSVVTTGGNRHTETVSTTFVEFSDEECLRIIELFTSQINLLQNKINEYYEKDPWAQKCQCSIS